MTGTAASEIEEVMLDPALQDVSEWVVDLSEAERLDAICAYALVRPLLMTSSPDVVVRVRGARKQAREVLRHIGAAHLITIDS
ncbi:hypothetical protein AB0F11_24900 [Streptomyces sp. NPDC032472]|uniref:hypothetical protein n=1 Tax=Streptomyces sp. NPDC032472 TaxID=3155018 RepID=UPI0033DE48E2